MNICKYDLSRISDRIDTVEIVIDILNAAVNQLRPDELFDYAELEQWALDNGFVKSES